MSQQYLTPGRAARMIGVSYETIRRYWLSGKCPTIQLPSGNRLIPREWVEAQPTFREVASPKAEPIADPA